MRFLFSYSLLFFLFVICIDIILLFTSKNPHCLTWTYWIDKIYMYINNTFKRVERKTFMWRHKNNFSIGSSCAFSLLVSLYLSLVCARILTFIWSNGDNVCPVSVMDVCESMDCAVVLMCLKSFFFFPSSRYSIFVFLYVHFAFWLFIRCKVFYR